MFVVDSSFVVAGLLPEEHSRFIDAMSSEMTRLGVAGPALLPFEVANVLWRKLRKGEITRAERQDALADFIAFSRDLEPVPDLKVQRAIAELSDRHDLTAYDAAYLEMAVRRGGILATLDGKLARAGRAERLDVRAP